jgi:hypothetical protein
MDEKVVGQFFDFFQDFLRLCQTENWPSNDTTELEISNAFIIANHVEKCLNKFQKNHILTEFLGNMTNNDDASNSLINFYFIDPPKFILKKVINSNTKTSQIDVALKSYIEIFSAAKLESSLIDLMVETASIQSLLKYFPQEIPKQKIVEFKSKLFLNELNTCDNPKDWFLSMFNDTNQETTDLIVVSIINNDVQNHNSVLSVVQLLTHVIKLKHHSHKDFWKRLFNVEEKLFLEMCTKHSDLFNIIGKALLDCGKLIQEHMSTEYFYIDLNYSELASNVQKICKNDDLKNEFFDLLRVCETDLSYWENML